MRKTGTNAIAAVRSRAVRSRPGIREFWCTLAHDDITWPAHGYYQCRKCRLLFRVPWDEPGRWHGATAGAAPHAGEVARPETVAA